MALPFLSHEYHCLPSFVCSVALTGRLLYTLPSAKLGDQQCGVEGLQGSPPVACEAPRPQGLREVVTGSLRAGPGWGAVLTSTPQGCGEAQSRAPRDDSEGSPPTCLPQAEGRCVNWSLEAHVPDSEPHPTL